MKILWDFEYSCWKITYDGQSAMEAASALRPSIPISDVTMPELNGIEASLRILERSRGCKRTLISGVAATADLLAEAGLQHDSFEILPKRPHLAVLMTNSRNLSTAPPAIFH